VLRRVALVVAGVSGGGGVWPPSSGWPGLAGGRGGVGGRRAEAERPCVGCWWLLAWFLDRRFWSHWWVGAVRSSGALVLAGAARRGTRRTQFLFVTFNFLLPFLFSVLYFV
jgi:hypothetical protein